MRLRLLALLVLAGTAAVSDASPVDAAFTARVSDAVARAVSRRLGAQAVVRVEDVAVTATPAEGPIQATPAPDARTGRASMFSLTVDTPSGPRRVGSAMATVHVETDVLRATRRLERGEELTEADVVAVRGMAAGVALKPLPVGVEAVGARLTRAVDEGGLLSTDVLSVQWAVRSGQQVRLRAVVDGIEAQGLGVATENGRVGAVIRVVNPDSGRTLVGRVVGIKEVEVQHGS